jgi:arabinose-5-phosphate isomerase
VEEFMTRKPVTIAEGKLATEVLAALEKHRVDDIVVVDDQSRPVGLVDTQDLTRMKLV